MIYMDSIIKSTVFIEGELVSKKQAKKKAACRATNGFSHINTFNQIKKYEKNYNFIKVAFP